MGGENFKRVQHSNCDMGLNQIILRHGNQNQNKKKYKKITDYPEETHV